MTPQPPTTQLGISTVMTGELLEDVNTGEQQVAMVDMVLLTVNTGGEQTNSLQMTPEQAMAVARGLSAAVGRLINAEIDDQGKPTGLLHRIHRLNQP